MSQKDAVLIASRVVALYFFFWAIDNLTYLPIHLLSFSHHSGEHSVLVGTSYWFRYYLEELILLCVRTALLSGAAWWFYRCGPKVQAFLLPAEHIGDTQRLPASDGRP